MEEEDYQKRYFLMGIKYDETLLLLDKAEEQVVELTKRVNILQEYINRLENAKGRN